MKTQSEPMNRLRQLPLAACLMAALGAPYANAASSRAQNPQGVLPVTSCADDGSPETLRSVIAAAASGDTVDLTQLKCSTITLASGAILIGVDDLAVQGPGADVLSIDGADVDRVFNHSGLGTLAISGVSLVNGRNDGGLPPLGGCVYSKGSVDLEFASVSGCTNNGLPETGKYTLIGGAGVAAAGHLSVESSTISGNSAAATGEGDISSYSVVGGGIFAAGGATIVNSTISGNSVSGPPGNTDYRSLAGGVLAATSLTVRNSTIAFNSAGSGAGGILVQGATIELQGSIVANNTVGETAVYAADIDGYGTITGANNLVTISGMALPADTLSADPLLQPLAANGGPTLTHALALKSPALDVGNNTASLQFDQRGDGYARVSGLGPDIGAFEYQQSFGVPTVAKNFTPETIAVEETSTLTITLANGNPVTATLSADLVDNLPASMMVADPPNATTDCPNGSVTADPSATAVSLATGAIIPADGQCSISVSVRGDSVGSHVNTIPPDALQTDLGSYPSAASAALEVTAQAPLLTMGFNPTTIQAGEVTTLVITLGNDNGVAAVTTADLVDELPPPLSIADAPAATTTCINATLLADPGSGTVALALGAGIPAGGSCEISVPVTAPLSGIFANTLPDGALQTTLGDSAGIVSAELTVTEPVTDRVFADGFDDVTPVLHAH